MITRADWVRLADCLERNIDRVEDRWLERVEREIVPGRFEGSRSELRNSVHDFLRRLSIALREPERSEKEGRAAWALTAREHGANRIRLGFDIDRLVYEFLLLRQTMTEVLSECDQVLTATQLARLADFIDGAIANSVSAYVASRDMQARRLEAEQIGFLTHELRNPLTTARIAASEIGRVGTIAPETHRPLQLLERSLARLEGLIADALEAERFQAGEVESNPVVGKLSELLHEELEIASKRATAKGLSLEVRWGAPEAEVRADPRLLGTVMHNLLDNAVKYTSEGVIQVDIADRDEEVEVSVENPCLEISPAELRLIFEPFKRAGGKKAPGGTGLGLAISRRAVEAMGGSIHAESEGGRCRFWYTLPKPAPSAARS